MPWDILAFKNANGERPMKKLYYLVASTIALSAMASPASAALLLFDLKATPLFGTPQTAVFQLDSMATPNRINDQSAFGISQIFFDNVSGVFNGINTTANIGFGRGNVANIQVLGTVLGPNRVNASTTGPSLFTGALSAPTFASGTFTTPRSSLVISPIAAAVPEPTTWMLMLIGMAGVGFSMRRTGNQTLRVQYT